MVETIIDSNSQKINQQRTFVVEDCVYTLIQVIILHFVGAIEQRQEKGRELLQNIKCKSLSDFTWYRDVFITKVMQRPYANSEYWKSKFIDGLPPLFSKRVKQKLLDLNSGIMIPWSTCTYGHLISVCVQEGLSLCNDMKIQYQMKKQNLTGKKEIGKFYNNVLVYFMFLNDPQPNWYQSLINAG